MAQRCQTPASRWLNRQILIIILDRKSTSSFLDFLGRRCGIPTPPSQRCTWQKQSSFNLLIEQTRKVHLKSLKFIYGSLQIHSFQVHFCKDYVKVCEKSEKFLNTNIPMEDCLFLNIWVPEEVLSSRSRSPVLVWIYGGGSSTLQLH